MKSARKGCSNRSSKLLGTSAVPPSPNKSRGGCQDDHEHEVDFRGELPPNENQKGRGGAANDVIERFYVFYMLETPPSRENQLNGYQQPDDQCGKSGEVYEQPGSQRRVRPAAQYRSPRHVKFPLHAANLGSISRAKHAETVTMEVQLIDARTEKQRTSRERTYRKLNL
jgi:hypothetical protein